jgi:hypothetical protein
VTDHTELELPTSPKQWERFLKHHWPPEAVDALAKDEDLRKELDSVWRLGDRFKVMAAVRTHVSDEDVLHMVQNDYDWREVFKYAGEGLTEDWTVPDDHYGDAPQLPVACDGDGTSVAPCLRADIKRVIAHWTGDNDADSWELVAEMKDGRFLYVQAGCDYTGWG